ncbi:MAG: bifunctional glutamate N-acetyltransferase/amino-acid acetyltransferase ArgJ [Pseudomonadales bacterium]|nr:bifunctional glutamate N-acetyltransferase/amino-acid acetyltransferase ArgJ [Pseudomonadales bacterium]
MSETAIKAEDLKSVAGVQVAAVASHIRYANRLDLVLIALDEGSTAAGVFTRNAFCAAPVHVARKHLASSAGASRYLLINTGNANAGTGQKGLADAQACCEAMARAAGVPVDTVLPFSTGVIGENLPVAKVEAGIPHALAALGQDWLNAAKGIMTTDTRPKARSVQLNLQGKTVTITGMTKGAGMIKPNMATMLGFVFTDAKITQPVLQELLNGVVDQSFNRITVDGDTSTNDCCILAATGKAGVEIAPASADDFARFEEALQALVKELAKDIIRDAEGAKKFVTVDIQGGGNTRECLLVAYAIAESPLVKTALSASDPNWGRILAAVGRAGIEELDVERISLHLGDVCIATNGMLAPGYTEAQGQAEMNKSEILITVNLGRGDARETVWTSDLSEEYVRINASYRS